MFAQLQQPSTSTEDCDEPVYELTTKGWPGGTWGTNAPSSKPNDHWLSQPGTDFDPGLPFGNYKICVVDSTQTTKYGAMLGGSTPTIYSNTSPDGGAVLDFDPNSWWSSSRSASGGMMFNRLRQEDGFTLPELLITLVIGLTVALGALSLVDVTMRRSGEISARVEAVQSGRTAMDIMTRELRSQVCLPPAVNAPRVSVARGVADRDHDVHRAARHRLSAVATPTPAAGLRSPDPTSASWRSSTTS